MLDTSFKRVPGDAGNPATWDFPVVHNVVRGADAQRVIDGEGRGLLDDFVSAGRDLIGQGCVAISTTCGFLALYQKELAGALSVPVATSSLLQIPVAENMLPQGKRVGVVTMDPVKLTARHLAAVGVRHEIPMEGLPRDGIFWAMIAQNQPADIGLLQAEVTDAVKRLLARHDNIGALVLECTNMSPYSAELASQFGMPVFDIVTMVNSLYRASAPFKYSVQR